MPPRQNLAQGRLHAAECVGAIGRDRLGEEASHHIQLHRQAGAGLQGEPIHESGFGIEAIRPFRIPIYQKVFPGDEDVVENDHRVVFIEAAG